MAGMTGSLTSGSLTGHMVRLMAPMILGNILQQLYNTVDVAVIGRYCGESEFAAVGVAGSVMNLFLFAVAGACSGIAVLFAQLYGAEDLNRLRQEHFLALSAGLAFSLALAGIGLSLTSPLLRLLQTPEELVALAHRYLSVILLALPATFLYNFYSALFRSVGRTAVPLLILAAATGLNLGLDILFLSVLGLGVAGAALATAAAQLCSALLCLLYLCLRTPSLRFRRGDCKMDRALLVKTLRFGAVTGFHQCALYLGKLLVQGAVNTGGTALITAFTSSVRIEGFANSFGDSGAVATSIIVAQNYGAGKQARLRRTFRVSLLLLSALGILMGLLMFTFAAPLTLLVTGGTQAAVLGQAVRYLRIVSVCYVLCFTGNTFAGYFDGTGRVTIPFAGAVSHITMRVILSWLLVPHFQLAAVAAATGIGWVWVNLLWWQIYRASDSRQTQPEPLIGSCSSHDFQ